MIVQLLSEHHLEFLSLKAGCRGSSESTLVKMSNCWKSHAAAHYPLEDRFSPRLGVYIAMLFPQIIPLYKIMKSKMINGSFKQYIGFNQTYENAQ